MKPKKETVPTSTSAVPSAAPVATAKLRMVVLGGNTEEMLFGEFQEEARQFITRRLKRGLEGAELAQRIEFHMSQLTKDHFEKWKKGEWDLSGS